MGSCLLICMYASRVVCNIKCMEEVWVSYGVITNNCIYFIKVHKIKVVVHKASLPPLSLVAVDKQYNM